jgi:hypothetical protein
LRGPEVAFVTTESCSLIVALLHVAPPLSGMKERDFPGLSAR